MTYPLRVVAVSGGLQRPSKSAALAQHLLNLIADELACDQRLVEPGPLAPRLAGAVWRPIAWARLAVQRALPLIALTRQARPSLAEAMVAA